MAAKPAFRWIRTAHAWAGAVLSFILFVLGFSGALLVFKDDYLRATLPAARADADLSPEALALVAERAENRFETGALRSIVFARQEFGVSQLRFHEDRRAYLDSEGKFAADWTGSARVEEWLFDLHHQLLTGHKGETVAGVSGLAAALLAITGLFAWWPARRAFSWRLWPHSKARRDVLAVHRNLGLLTAGPVLILSLTGAAMVYSSETKILLSAFDGGRKQQPAEFLASEGDIDWEKALQAAQTAFPDAQLRVASWPRKPGDPAVVRLKRAGEWHPNGRTYAYIDPATTTLVGAADALAGPISERTFNTLYPVHSARLGDGLPARLYDLFVLLSGLALSTLGLFGVYAFLQKRLALLPKSIRN